MNHFVHNNSKWSKNFDKRQHRTARISHREQCLVTVITLEHCRQLPQSRCRWCWYFCCVHCYSTDSQCCAMSRKIPPELPLSVGTSTHPPIGISIISAVFADRHTDVLTDKQTDHATLSVAIDAHLMHAMRSSNFRKKYFMDFDRKPPHYERLKYRDCCTSDSGRHAWPCGRYKLTCIIISSSKERNGRVFI